MSKKYKSTNNEFGLVSVLYREETRMKKLWPIMTLVICYFFSSTTVLAQELGEFCWKETNTLCVLKLNTTQHNSFFSFIGNEVCPDGAFSHVSGSGFISDNQVNVGLNVISEFRFLPEISVIISYELMGAINLSDLSFSAAKTDTNAIQVTQQRANYISAVCDS